MRKIPFHYLIALTAFMLFIALYFVNPTDSVLIPKCPFKLLTGYACPGCGIQRAIHAALHGYWIEAWQYNRFLIYSFPYLCCIVFTEYIAKKQWKMRLRGIFEGRIAIGLYIILFFIWGIARNVWKI